MESLTLVDSGIFIHFLRQGRDPVEALRLHFESLDLATCGVIRVEVLRGIRVPRAQERLRAFLDVLICAPTDEMLWDTAADLAWRLDRAGSVLPLQDIVIAACAIRMEAELLTLDGHFAAIPRLRLAPIPAGWL